MHVLCLRLPLKAQIVMSERWRRLKAQMIEKRSKLGESQTLQQFSRDVDEIEAWISEKLQTATDESYKDPTNIQVHTTARISRASTEEHAESLNESEHFTYEFSREIMLITILIN